MDDVVILEWTFSPPDYFEEETRIEHENYTMTIGAGKVEARINPAAYDEEHKMRDELHESLNGRFLAVQLITHKPYKLSKASMHRLHPNGSEKPTVFIGSVFQETVIQPVDNVEKDRDDNILSDTRRDRIEKKKELGELVEKYRLQDDFVESMLSFHDAAIHDPKNELIHLYDIWETLKARFGSQAAALTTLAIDDSDRSTLGRLANEEPIRQGRHRGAMVINLRDATETELNEARKIASNMIEAYLRYLESQSA